MEFLDYKNIPYMNQDIEFPAPKEISAIREKVISADALWFFTPEYNGSISGVLKNLFDWLSRPLDLSKMGEPRILADKIVTLSGAGGGSATINSRTYLKGLLTNLVGGGAKVVYGDGVGISLPASAWQTGILELDTTHKEELTKQAEELLKHI